MTARTRIALLGTLSHLHEQPIGYDLAELARIVARAQPDLLGVEVEREEIERGDLSGAPLEVRRALVPLARRSDVVLVPIGAGSPEELRARHGGLRAGLTRAMDASLRLVQEAADDARRVNSAMVGHLCALICRLEALSCGERGRKAWKATNERMLAGILAAVRRDPGTRVLVAVQCRRKHWLEPKLRKLPELEIVDYWEL